MEKFSLNTILSLMFTSLSHNTYFVSGFFIVLGIIFLYLVIQILLFFLNFHKKLFIASMQFPVIDKEHQQEVTEQIKEIFSSLHGNILSPLDKLFIEIIKVDTYITIQIGSNKPAILEKCKRLFSQLEGVRFTQTAEDALSKLTTWQGKSMYASQSFLPAGKNPYFYDSLITFLSSLPSQKQAGVQFVLRGVQKKFFIERRMLLLERKIRDEKRRIDPTEHQTIQGYQQKMSENLFRVRVHIFATDQNDVDSLKSSFQSLNNQKNNWYSYPLSLYKKAILTGRFIAPESLFDFIPMFREMNGSYLTSSEMASLFHPSSTQPARYLPEEQKQIEATPEYVEKGEDNMQIGTVNTLDGTKKPIYFPLDSFKRHLYLIGKTGRGKSTVLFSLITKLSQKKNGTLILLDPHSDLAKDVIGNVPQDNLVYLPNTSEQDFTFTFNPLFTWGLSEYEKVAVRDMLLDILKSETEDEAASTTTGTATMNRIKIAVEIALAFPDVYFDYLTSVKKLSKKVAEAIVQERQLTLNDLPYLYLKEAHYVDMLEEVFQNQQTELGRYIRKSLNNHVNQIPVVEAVQARLQQLLHPSIALITEGNKLHFPEIIASDKTFVLPIPEEVYGSRGQRTLLKMFLSFLWLYKRKVPEPKRSNTYIFLDEMQRVQIGIIPTIISEARKYKLYLVIANQHLGQLSESIRDAIAGNIGTIIAFTLGAGTIGAELIAKVFGKRVTEEDLLNLPAFNAFLQTEDDNHNTLARFTFQTQKVGETRLSEKQEQKLSEKSLQQYGESKKEIKKRLNMKQENPLKYFTEGI